MNSVKIVEDFWAAVWNARNPEAVDKFVVDDFIITTGGVDIVTKERFKEWVRQFLEKINNLEFEVVETFQNEDGSRVASRWRITGRGCPFLAPVEPFFPQLPAFARDSCCSARS
jgi:SnoaL-like domain